MVDGLIDISMFSNRQVFPANLFFRRSSVSRNKNMIALKPLLLAWLAGTSSAFAVMHSIDDSAQGHRVKNEWSFDRRFSARAQSKSTNSPKSFIFVYKAHN